MQVHQHSGIEIEARTGPHAGLRATFIKSPVLIGRASSNDISLSDDSTVSSIHAALHWEKGAWWLKDCGSRNGTFLCAKKGRLPVHSEIRLPDAQDIYVGSTRLSLLCNRNAEAETQGGPSHSVVEETPPPGLVISITCQQGSLLCHLASTDPTVATYSRGYDHIVLDEIDRRLEELVSRLNLHSDAEGAPKQEPMYDKLRQAGSMISDRLLPKKIIEKIGQAHGGNLFVSLHPDLIRVPWEIALSEGEPWCLRFDMGRQILLEEVSVRISRRRAAKAPRILIVADPTEDLPETRETAEKIFQSILSQHPLLNVNLLIGGRVTREELLARFEETDIVYYNGHAEHDLENPAKSAWRLKDGGLTCEHFAALKTPPELVFANACESGRESPWTEPRLRLEHLTGMVSSFLAAGVTHYIGTMWPIAPEGGSVFAERFFVGLLQGAPIGACVREARQHVIDDTGVDGLVWASYVLYGDPARRFV